METKSISAKQLRLLKLLSSRPLDESLLDEVKELMQKRLLQGIDSDMDELWKQNGWTLETIEQWGKEHLRGNNKEQ